jgi:hypothetical protein
VYRILQGGTRGERADVRNGGLADGRHPGQDDLVAKERGHTLSVQELFERRLPVVFFIEATCRDQQALKRDQPRSHFRMQGRRKAREVQARREQRGLSTYSRVDGDRGRRRDRPHVEQREQTEKQGIDARRDVAERRVRVGALAIPLDRNREGVTAQIRGRFEQSDFVIAVEQPRAAQACNPRTDYRDLHMRERI